MQNNSLQFQSATKPNDVGPVMTSNPMPGYILVVIIGCALSLSAYILGARMVDDEIAAVQQQQSDEIVQSYAEQLQTLMGQFSGIVDAVSELPDEDLLSLKNKKATSSIVDSARPFDFIAYQGDIAGKNKLYLLDRKLSNLDLSTLKILAVNNAEFNKTLQNQRFKSDNVNILSNKYLSQALNYLGGEDTPYLKLIFIKRIFSANQKSAQDASWLIAEERVEDFLPSAWHRSFPFAESIIIRDPSTGDIVYRYEQSDKYYQSPEILKIIDMGGQSWSITTRFSKTKSIELLEKGPAAIAGIIFFFSIVLSGFLYIQSRNEKIIFYARKGLEAKNADLELELEEKDKITFELKKAQSDNLSIINSIGDIVFELDVKGNFSFLNAAWKTVTGFNNNDFLGKNLFSLIHTDSQLAELNKFEDFVKGNIAAYRSEILLRTIDGGYRAVEIFFSIVRRHEDGTLYAVGSAADREDHRRVERALGHAEEKFRQIVDHAAWAIYQITPDGIILNANLSFYSILGYVDEDDFKTRVSSILTQIYVDPQERKALLQEVNSSHAINGRDTRVLDKNGDMLWVRENIRAVKNETGAILYYEGSFEDVTERKEASILLQEAKLNSDMANRAKSEFITNMSHELRTPLNSIIGFSEIIKSESLGPLNNDSYKEYSLEIYNSGRRLLHIINEILEISKIEMRGKELQESSVKLTPLISGCVDMLQSQATINEITIINDMAGAPTLVADERALKQVLSNILSNAIKFTPQGGSVRLSYERAADGGLVLSFVDTGIGLDPDEIKKALSPFGQVGAALNQKNSGAGLGLTLAKSLVELHQGQLDIVSQKGIGTTVFIKFPPKRVVVDPS